ncbi:MAG: cation-transporting P-type ATPase, partial [Coriobacteriia bacterium]|nr:cation-transporting P-type ATPase [Coriobacteriia bacterium]
MPEPGSISPATSPAAYSVEAAHTIPAEDTLARLSASPDGLSDVEAEKRLVVLGPNALPEQRVRTLPSIVLDQFKDFLILLLMGAAVISGMLGEIADTIAIAVIVI